MYKNLSNEEKNRKQEYGFEWYKDLSKDKKQRLAEYKKGNYKMLRNTSGVAQYRLWFLAITVNMRQF